MSNPASNFRTCIRTSTTRDQITCPIVVVTKDRERLRVAQVIADRLASETGALELIGDPSVNPTRLCEVERDHGMFNLA